MISFLAWGLLIFAILWIITYRKRDKDLWNINGFIIKHWYFICAFLIDNIIMLWVNIYYELRAGFFVLNILLTVISMIMIISLFFSSKSKNEEEQSNINIQSEYTTTSNNMQYVIMKNKVNTYALVGFILAAIPLSSLIGLILSHVALRDKLVQNGVERGKSLARWGVFFGWFGIILTIIAIIVGIYIASQDNSSVSNYDEY